MSDCIFCKIAGGEIPAKVSYRDEEMIAFDDISPKAPVHVLIIPREHLATLNDPGPEQEGLLGRMMTRAALIAKERGVAESGYRVLVNCNPDGGQEVFHLHLHLIGGRKLGPMA
ncbi:MAG: histidine triad nucleotide-binding protein [bacterium]|nr:MAG: histidine triad nucleotide-binding protein [bacterium]